MTSSLADYAVSAQGILPKDHGFVASNVAAQAVSAQGALATDSGFAAPNLAAQAVPVQVFSAQGALATNSGLVAPDLAAQAVPVQAVSVPGLVAPVLATHAVLAPGLVAPDLAAEAVPEPCQPILVLPFLPGISQKLREIATSYDVKTWHTYPGKSLDPFTKHRGRTPASKSQNTVYCAQCTCGIQYVGESGRNLKCRLAEHTRKSLIAPFPSIAGAVAWRTSPTCQIRKFWPKKGIRSKGRSSKACVSTIKRRVCVIVDCLLNCLRSGKSVLVLSLGNLLVLTDPCSCNVSLSRLAV